MSPEERRLLTDLFDRVRGASSTPRDPEAEDLIAEKLRAQPYATYFLAQAVIIQDQALKATTARVEELEEEVRRLESGQHPDHPQGGGFLGGLTSLFGGGQSSTTQPGRDTYQQREGRLYDNDAQTHRDPEPAAGPWGRAAAAGPWSQQAAPSGGGFLHSALTTAAGVAGGVLVADAVRGLFSQHMGGTNITSAAGFGNFGQTPVEETTVNNYFLNDDKTDSNRSGDSPSTTSVADNSNDDDDDTNYDFSDFGGNDSDFT